MTDKPLRAYHVHDGDDGHEIVFAVNGVAARRIGANELGTDFSSVEFCRRAPQFDQFAPGPIPTKAMIDNGWIVTCFSCDREVSDDTYDYENEIQLTPVFDGDIVFCCAKCRSNYYADLARRRKVESETIEATVGLVVAKYPGAIIGSQSVFASSAKKEWPEVVSAWIEFTFPGAQHGRARLFYERFTSRDEVDFDLTVAKGDIDAWHAWRAAGCPAVMPATEAA